MVRLRVTVDFTDVPRAQRLGLTRWVVQTLIPVLRDAPMPVSLHLEQITTPPDEGDRNGAG